MSHQVTLPHTMHLLSLLESVYRGKTNADNTRLIQLKSSTGDSWFNVHDSDNFTQICHSILAGEIRATKYATEPLINTPLIVSKDAFRKRLVYKFKVHISNDKLNLARLVIVL